MKQSTITHPSVCYLTSSMTKLQEVNIIIVLDQEESNLLMCHRIKDPYKGLYNFVGGKKHRNESDFDAAYRELFEETGIKKTDIELDYLYKTQYFKDKIELQVFYGTLNKEVSLKKEVNPLLWIDFDNDFSDETKFAGQGNIKHMLLLLRDLKLDNR